MQTNSVKKIYDCRKINFRALVCNTLATNGCNETIIINNMHIYLHGDIVEHAKNLLKSFGKNP